MTATDVVNTYLNAFYSGDFERARLYLAPTFHFKGPFLEANDCDAYLKSALPLAHIVKGHRLVGQWAEDDEVASIYEVMLETPAGTGKVMMSEWHTVHNTKLSTSRLILDIAAFRALVPSAG